MIIRKGVSTLKFLRSWRDLFFLEVGKNRGTRILLCSFIIANVWIIADIMSGNVDNDLIDNLICLGLGVVAERIVPWGKSTEGADKRLKRVNKQLMQSLKESNVLLNKMVDIQKNQMEKESQPKA